jgi:uncharacterized pyridoxamine 5'-phosphate oxidase family protein
MLMTIGEDAVPIGRPVLPLFLDNDPCLYLLTHPNSKKVSHVMADADVEVATAHERALWRSLRGRTVFDDMTAGWPAVAAPVLHNSSCFHLTDEWQIRQSCFR